MEVFHENVPICCKTNLLEGRFQISLPSRQNIFGQNLPGQNFFFEIMPISFGTKPPTGKKYSVLRTDIFQRQNVKGKIEIRGGDFVP